MANFVGTTSSNGIDITPKQYNAIQKLLKRYHFSMEDVHIGSETHFGIWGYDWLNIIPIVDSEPNYDANDVCDEFLNALRVIFTPKQRLIIQCVGHEKCRFPLAAMQITVTKDKVEWWHFPES